MKFRASSKGTSGVIVEIKAFVFLTIAISIISCGIINYILAKRDSIPESIRNGYENPYSTYLGISALFIFLEFIIYQLVYRIFLRHKKSMMVKVVAGLLVGLIPVTILNFSTFGMLGLTDPAWLTELIILGLSGAMIPVVKQMFWADIKNQKR